MLIAKIVAVTMTAITIDYQVVNQRASDLYVFATLFHTAPSGAQSDEPTLAYVGKDSEGRTVVGKFLVSVPHGMKVEVAEVPYLMKLAPGQSVTGRMVVPLPLTLRHPYLQASPDAPLANPVHQLVVRLGVLDAATFPDKATVVSPVKGKDDVFICDYGFGLQLQEFFDAPVDLGQQSAPSRL